VLDFFYFLAYSDHEECCKEGELKGDEIGAQCTVTGLAYYARYLLPNCETTANSTMLIGAATQSAWKVVTILTTITDCDHHFLAKMCTFSILERNVTFILGLCPKDVRTVLYDDTAA
jgi:hypothetical protein